MSYYPLEDLCEAHQRGTLATLCDQTGIVAVGSTLYRFKRAILSRGGVSLPDWLLEALEESVNRLVRSIKPGDCYLDLRKYTVFGPSVLGSWNHIWIRGIAPKSRMATCPQITDMSWKQPCLKVLGADLGNQAVVLEYAGESRC